MIRIFCSDFLKGTALFLWIFSVSLPFYGISQAEEVSKEPPKEIKESKEAKALKEEQKKNREVQLASWTAHILRESPNQIKDLTFNSTQVPVTLLPKEDVMRPLVEIEGHFRRPGWNLLSQGESLLGTASDKTIFRIYFYLNGRNNKITLTAQGPHGEVETEDITLLAPQAQEFRISPRWGELLVSLGAGNFSFHQTDFGTFTSKTGVVSLTYTTPEWKTRLGIVADARSTLLTFQGSPSDYGPQLMMGRLDGTYTLAPSEKHRFQNTIVLGGAYFTLLSNGSPFGFANLMTPEIGFRSYYPLNYYSGFLGNIRLAPLGLSSGIAEYAIDLNLGWTLRLPNFHRIEFNFNYSDLAFQADPATKIQTNLLSLRIGYTI